MYVKLFGDILQSSIWAEDPETKVVWVTLLALANQDGLVRATAPGISHEARISMARTVEIIKLLEAPDPHSRTPDNEGRRIERTDGGYLILNYRKYRDMHDQEKVREQWRERSRNYRQRHAESRAVTPRHEKSRQAEAEAEAEAEAKKVDPPYPPKGGADMVAVSEVLSDLNQVARTHFRGSKATARNIHARLAEGHTLDNFRAVHRKKVAEWLGTEMQKYLRPSTLYRASHFDEYLHAPECRRKLRPGDVSAEFAHAEVPFT